MQHWFRFLPNVGMYVSIADEIEAVDDAIDSHERALKKLNLQRAKLEKRAEREALKDWTEEEIMTARMHSITKAPILAGKDHMRKQELER